MKYLVFVFILLGSICVLSFSSDYSGEKKSIDLALLRSIDYVSFRKGEVLEYDASYGIFNAAKATLEIQPQTVLINDRPTMHVIGKAKSLGTFNWFFKI